MTTASYSYKAAYQKFTVPADVFSLAIVCHGAGSGANQGGAVTGSLAVKPGQVLWIVCGAPGDIHSGSSGGARVWGGGGAGGDGSGYAGGNGGGGYSSVRRATSTGGVDGTIVCVAGGAAGDSGDGGTGGAGGGTTGGSGGRGSSGSNSTSAATGGTPTQGGNGGTSSSGSQFNGGNAADTVLGAYGGTGGSANNYCHGGGGGGGGYHQGGGGQASSTGYAPGGGGGGGSNYSGGLAGATNTRGNGGTGGGNVTITYTATPTNDNPSTPTDEKMSSAALALTTPVDEQVTRSTGSVGIGALLSDPDKDKVRLLVRWSTDKSFATYHNTYSDYVASGSRANVSLTGLAQNTHYYVRLYAQDDGTGTLYSIGYKSLNFWTNRPPNPPTPTNPQENASVPAIGSTVFTWTHSDPDVIGSDIDNMTGWNFRYRTAATPNAGPGPWTTILQSSNTFPSWTINPGTFKGNTFYEWQVATKDEQGLWSDWSIPISFFATSTSTPPVLTGPTNTAALDVTDPQTFTWRFVDPDPTDVQSRADFRYRVVGQPDSSWITLTGAVDPGVPGHAGSWVMPGGTFVEGYQYEWQVRTYDTIGAGGPSSWSNSYTFWAIDTPGSAIAGVPVAVSPIVQGSLGCGTYRVFIYTQGGARLVGEVEPITDVTFSRLRDDISGCLLHTNGFSADCCALYADLHCWLHELVVFRDGVRVWEGPITRIGYQVDSVEIEAKDVMAYVYRRILRQGYNDSYQLISPALPGLPSNPENVRPVPTVVQRAALIITNALAPSDPNVLPYLTTIQFPDDAGESRIVEDYSRTAWEEVDDLAASAGMDYTVVGRRIVLWDTHRPLGRLPEMRDGDFSDPPVVTEYGMNLSNYMAVTNGSGIWGAATPEGQTSDFQAYGPIEMLASSYSESESATDEVLTQASKDKAIGDLTRQAVLNIKHRWPTPVIVRVPDNATLSPDVGVGFDQLVPGVWIPLRSDSTCRTVEQWQKLDSVTISFDASGEKVAVVMSPAPGAGADPDADQGATEGA